MYEDIIGKARDVATRFSRSPQFSLPIALKGDPIFVSRGFNDVERNRQNDKLLFPRTRRRYTMWRARANSSTLHHYKQFQRGQRNRAVCGTSSIGETPFLVLTLLGLLSGNIFLRLCSLRVSIMYPKLTLRYRNLWDG